MAHDALGAHARDELGLSEMHSARPIQAALASAGTFAAGAALPLLMVVFIPLSYLVPVVAVSSLIFLAIMGGVAARIGGANIWIGAGRVTFWGALAMAITAGIGHLFGTVV
jgi:VIT1/CCC1 family predicted Fe2+/Mn2+ transporter